MQDKILCPNCKTEIEITEVMSAQLAEKLRGDIEAQMAPKRQALEAQARQIKEQQARIEQAQSDLDEQVRQRTESMRKEIEAKARQRAGEELAVELKDREEQLKEAQVKIEKAREQEIEWRRKERALAEREARLQLQQAQMEEENRKQLEAQRGQIEEKASQKAREEMTRQMELQNQQLEELQQKLKETQANELALRKKETELERKSEELELTLQRQLSEEREKIRTEAIKKQTEEYRLKEAEKDKKISDLISQLEEAKRRAQQGSQQAQGEILELALEELLGRVFPADSIEEVPKGIRGGDVIQRVQNGAGLDCGTILWESKRTKNWSKSWLAKLRQDQRNARASAAVLVSEALPEDVDHFTQLEGVWICNWSCAASLAAVLRLGLMETAKAKQALDGQHGKMQRVYNYLAGTDFRNRVTGVVESVITMKNDLEQEKRALQKQWAKREKQIDQAIFAMAGMYGDFQGIIGGTLPEIEGMTMLQLEAGN